MKADEFIRKLFKGGKGNIIISNFDIQIKMRIDTFGIKDNINLLSKEMHMEVERESTLNKKVLKHKKIYVKDVNFLEEENGTKRRNKKL